MIYAIYRTRHGVSVPIAMANDLDGLTRRFVKIVTAFRRIAPHLALPYHVAAIGRTNK